MKIQENPNNFVPEKKDQFDWNLGLICEESNLELFGEGVIENFRLIEFFGFLTKNLIFRLQLQNFPVFSKKESLLL